MRRWGVGLLVVGGLWGCQPEEPGSAPVSVVEPPFDAADALRRSHGAPLPRGLAQARRLLPPAPQADPMAALGAETWGRLDPDLGAAMLEALEDEPPEDVATYGAGTFTWEELFGSGYASGELGLCEDPYALLEFSEGGQDYEARADLYSFLALTGPPAALFMRLSETCTAAVDASGDIEAAVLSGECTLEEEHGFFPDGGECRSCVAERGEVSACLAEALCDEEVPQTGMYGAQWYEWAEAEVLACAPDIRAKVLFASRDLPDDGTVPGPWDHYGWKWLCFELRQTTGLMGMNCLVREVVGEELGDAYGEGLLTRLDWIREAGSDELEHVDRMGYTRRLHLDDGTVLAHDVLSFGGTGQISTPFVPEDGNGDGAIDDADWGLAGHGGWGFNPRLLRPEGTNASDPDDTFARDWLAAVVLKTATTRAGVPINSMNYTRCEEWAGPHEDGSWTCVRNGAPKLPWFADNHVVWYDAAQTRITLSAMMTLGSTGLPDELVPGGFVPHIAGTASLANPFWDDCSWPHTFVPDHIRTEDMPHDWGGPASMDAHTYKFGKDPEQDLRVVLATPQARGFCPER
jgi:hypothetical protein